MPARRKRATTAEDLYHLQLITDCQISPDGKYIVYCVQRVDQEIQKRYANLWVAPTNGGRPWQFTYGDHVDGRPRWSPDGNEIAFVSNRGNNSNGKKPPQLYIIPFHGGEAKLLTQLQGEIGPFEWSPDGKQFACQLRKKDQEVIEREADEHKVELGVVSRHITRVFFKLDGSGYLPKERWHIWAIDTRTGHAKQLTDNEIFDELEPGWSPDGQEIVFCSNRCDDPDLDPDAIDLFIIPAEGGELRKVETPLGPKQKPSFSPDGKWLVYLGHKGRRQWWRNTGLWIVPADGRREPRNLTGSFDFSVSNATANDLPGLLPLMPPVWSKDSNTIYFQVSHHGSTLLKSVTLDGSGDVGECGLQTVIGDPGVVGPCTFDRDQSRLAYLHSDMTDLGQVWVQNMADGFTRKLTDVNEELLRDRDLGTIEEIWFKGAAGNDLQGWILRPPNFDAAKKYPSILQIHGGPRAQYGNFFTHEFYFLAAHGYVVHFCNPQGGLGYGEEHARAIVGKWGTADYDDLMTWADLVQQRPYIDAERKGVTGGSYGGYMTAWIIGHTNHFKAAVAQRCISNLTSYFGSSDANWSQQDEWGDIPPWENIEHYWQQSPIKYIGNVTTPTLVIHSEQDLRCPIEQGEQVFVALKTLGVDTEMVRFPDESHDLSRGGRTDRRIVRLGHILRWFDRYLKD